MRDGDEDAGIAVGCRRGDEGRRFTALLKMMFFVGLTTHRPAADMIDMRTVEGKN